MNIKPYLFHFPILNLAAYLNLKNLQPHLPIFHIGDKTLLELDIEPSASNARALLGPSQLKQYSTLNLLDGLQAFTRESMIIKAFGLSLVPSHQRQTFKNVRISQSRAIIACSTFPNPLDTQDSLKDAILALRFKLRIEVPVCVLCIASSQILL